MKIKRIALGAFIGASLFAASALYIAASALVPSTMVVHDQKTCGGVCGTNAPCGNPNCPRCTMDVNYNWSCTS
jgi:hypothetical protein